MNGKAHMSAGIASAAITLNIMHLNYVENPTSAMASAGVLVLGSFIGSIFPDIDMKNTTISNKAPWARALFNIFTFGKIKHRHETHSIFLLLSLILLFLFNVGLWKFFWLGCGIGVLSHLILDVVTGKIFIFAPFSKFRIGAHILKGKLMDYIVRIGCWSLVLYQIAILLPI